MSRVPLKTQIRSALRRIWMWSDLKKNALAASRVSRGVYRCGVCAQLVGPKLMDVDHIVKVTPNGFDPDKNPREWGMVIERLLYVKPEGLLAICKPCHKTKTLEERRETKQANIKKKTRNKKTKRTTKRLRPSRNR